MLLTDWEPSNAGNLTDFFKEIVPADKAYYPTGAHAAGVIAYRNDVFTEETAPKTWEDFAKPEYKDKIGIADPSVAAPAYPFVSYFFNSKGMDSGKEYFGSLFENGLKVYPKNPQVVQALASGEIAVAEQRIRHDRFRRADQHHLAGRRRTGICTCGSDQREDGSAGGCEEIHRIPFTAGDTAAAGGCGR